MQHPNFCVIYTFEVKPEYEQEFIQIWRELTLHIRDHYNGLGSRLHRINKRPYCYLAYAQWPSREAWLNRVPSDAVQSKLRERMIEVCISIDVTYELDVVEAGNLL